MIAAPVMRGKKSSHQTESHQPHLNHSFFFPLCRAHMQQFWRPSNQPASSRFIKPQNKLKITCLHYSQVGESWHLFTRRWKCERKDGEMRIYRRVHFPTSDRFDPVDSLFLMSRSRKDLTIGRPHDGESGKKFLWWCVRQACCIRVNSPSTHMRSHQTRPAAFPSLRPIRPDGCPSNCMHMHMMIWIWCMVQVQLVIQSIHPSLLEAWLVVTSIYAGN